MWSATVPRLGVRTALAWLAPAAWPVQAALAITAAATVLLAYATGQPAIAIAALILMAHDVLGLWGSFAIHELGHALVLGRARGVAAITVERGLLRLSVTPHGSILGRDAFLAAAVGPGCCVAIGLLLWACAPHTMLHAWYLAHAVFLTPLFNDGRTLIRSSRRWNGRLRLPASSGAMAPLD